MKGTWEQVSVEEKEHHVDAREGHNAREERLHQEGHAYLPERNQ